MAVLVSTWNIITDISFSEDWPLSALVRGERDLLFMTFPLTVFLRNLFWERCWSSRVRLRIVMGGCNFTAAIVTESWRKCRDEFPVTEEQPQVMINIITPSWTSPPFHICFDPADLSLHFRSYYCSHLFHSRIAGQGLNCHGDGTPSHFNISKQTPWHLDTSQYCIARAWCLYCCGILRALASLGLWTIYCKEAVAKLNCVAP